ncbi:prepilin-type N-terminal cleavage/methylation domain-containing protein [Lysobacter sp. TY2-98]|uniref:GspH/FimT family pseudopilin n=1 Tax=Lysobacter sp. TY2-98 TaxID=2290922 RepID=UPI000E201200|nr:GspH/FimT family pseudopilin [Lysobacter sp. TY2-98]AXK71490.1 prepilin-type N-terminal cleavage/methylation domain-containing protein [Lysobacter sp. TY2-98]
MRKESGFTLVELLVALCVLSICVGTAVPSFARLLERQRATSTMNALVEYMAEARAAAIMSRRDAVLCPSVDGSTCTGGTDWSRGWILFQDDNGDRAPSAVDRLVRVEARSSPGVLTIRSTTGRRSLRYLPDGRSAGANLTLSVCDRAGNLLGSVIVNNTGRARSERPKPSARCPT